MKTWLGEVLDALRLRGAALARVADRPEAFLHGLLVIVAVALIAGLPALVADIASGFRPLALEPSDVQPDVSGALERMRPFLLGSGLPEGVIEQIIETAEGNALMAGAVVTEIRELPTALPRPVAQSFRAIGAWLSLPFAGSPFPLAVAALSTWLGYGVWVMLTAKLLGGRGTLHGFFGATGFFAAPHVLAILSPVPVVGSILAIVAFIWGVAIYVIATAASHRLSAGRALVAVFAPLVFLATLVTLLFIFVAMAALLASGSR